jgi:hypothetical protein
MPGYRICSLDAEGLIRHVRSEAFETDEAAMAVAADLAERFATVEIWNNGRLIGNVRRDVEPSDGSDQPGQEQERHTSSEARKDTVDAGADRLFRTHAALPGTVGRPVSERPGSARLLGFARWHVVAQLQGGLARHARQHDPIRFNQA